MCKPSEVGEKLGPRGRQSEGERVGGPVMKALVGRGRREHWRVLFQALRVQVSLALTWHWLLLLFLCSPYACVSGEGVVRLGGCDVSGPEHTPETLPSFPQAQPPVLMAASTALILATSPCTSLPDGSMTEFVVSEIPLGLVGVKGSRWREGTLSLMVPLSLSSDCCDGTDEYNSGTICENICKYVGATHPSRTLPLPTH